jgi:hypothetical protein
VLGCGCCWIDQCHLCKYIVLRCVHIKLIIYIILDDNCVSML